MPQTPLFGPPPKAPDVSLPSDPNDFATKVKDFFSGFLGIKPGLTDPKSSSATAFGDSVGQLNPEHLMLGPVMGMTKFLTADRIPNVAARQGSTITRLNDLYKYLAKSVRDGKVTASDATKTLEIANKYPRTLAHTNAIRSFDELHPDDYDQLFNPTTMGMNVPSIEPKMSSIILNPNVGSMKMGSEHPQAETFAHELQHTGQNIADKDFPQKYANETIDKGYDRNKYEIAARTGSFKRTNPPGTDIPKSVITNQTPLISQLLTELSQPKTIAKLAAAGLGTAGILKAKSFINSLQKKQDSTLSDAFGKSPQALKKYYDELKASRDTSKLPVTDVKTMLTNALADLKKSK